jgi:glycerophosphoryl diester phosphodiesterase
MGCYKVKVSGKTGWIAKRDVAVIVQKPLDLRAVTPVKAVPMWSVCSSRAARTRTIPKGAVLMTTMTTNVGCYKVIYGGRTGWIAKAGTSKVTYPKFSTRALTSVHHWSGAGMSNVNGAVSVHRGGNYEDVSVTVTNQTLAAFRAALDKGFTDLEFDIRYTKDRIPVVSHDETSIWPADGGRAIQDLDCSQQRDGDDVPADERERESACDLTLDDLLTLVSDYRQAHPSTPAITLRPESKKYTGQNAKSEREDAEALAREIHAKRLSKQSIIQTFDFDKIPWIKQIDSHIRVEALISSPSPATLADAADKGADEYSYSASVHNGGNRWLNELAHRRGMTVSTWGAEASKPFHLSVFAQQLSQGAETVIVDNPQTVVAAVASSTCAPVWKDTPNRSVLSRTLKGGQRASTATVLGFAYGLPTSSGLENVTIRVTSSAVVKTSDLVVSPADSSDARDRAKLQQTGAGTWEAAVPVSRLGKLNLGLNGRTTSKLTVTVTGYTENVCTVGTAR